MYAGVATPAPCPAGTRHAAVLVVLRGEATLGPALAPARAPIPASTLAVASGPAMAVFLATGAQYGMSGYFPSNTAMQKRRREIEAARSAARPAARPAAQPAARPAARPAAEEAVFSAAGARYGLSVARKQMF